MASLIKRFCSFLVQAAPRIVSGLKKVEKTKNGVEEVDKGLNRQYFDVQDFGAFRHMWQFTTFRGYCAKTIWLGPEKGKFKFNVDSSYCGLKRVATVGGVLRNENGELLAAFSDSLNFEECYCSTGAELHGIVKGIQMLISWGFTGDVIIETDSLHSILIVQDVKWKRWYIDEDITAGMSNERMIAVINQNKGNALRKAVTEELRKIKPDTFELVYVSRKRNVTADALAKEHGYGPTKTIKSEKELKSPNARSAYFRDKSQWSKRRGK